jgi:hypothetical protein
VGNSYSIRGRDPATKKFFQRTFELLEKYDTRKVKADRFDVVPPVTNDAVLTVKNDGTYDYGLLALRRIGFLAS